MPLTPILPHFLIPSLYSMSDSMSLFVSPSICAYLLLSVYISISLSIILICPYHFLSQSIFVSFSPCVFILLSLFMCVCPFIVSCISLYAPPFHLLCLYVPILKKVKKEVRRNGRGDGVERSERERKNKYATMDNIHTSAL